jgi:hypothetical protein
MVLLVGNKLFLMYLNKTYPKEEIEAAFEPITTKYGIKIKYEIDDEYFSPLKNPPIPAGPPHSSKISPIRQRVLMRYPAILRKAFGKYPVEVIKKYLIAIYFSGEIDAEGDKAGGTYDPFRKIVYLVDNGGKSDDEALGTFHHEFSSLLLTRHRSIVRSWEDNNPKGFKYLDEIYNTWKEANDTAKTFKIEDCYEKGFVNDYGLTNLENDFNEYSEMIFTYPEKFKKIMGQYPRVRGKFKGWLEFYHSIDPIFTEDYLFGKSVRASK